MCKHSKSHRQDGAGARGRRRARLSRGRGPRRRTISQRNSHGACFSRRVCAILRSLADSFAPFLWQPSGLGTRVCTLATRVSGMRRSFGSYLQML